MARGNTQGKLRALVLAAMMLFAVVPAPTGAELLSGGNASVSQVGNAPDVVINDAKIYSGNSSTVEVAYDASGTGSSASNLAIVLYGPSNNVIATNTSLGKEGLSGVAKVEVKSGRVSDFTVTAKVDNVADRSPAFASDTASITVTQFYTAPWVNETSQTYDPETDTTVKVPFNASGVVGSSSHLAFELVDSKGNTIDTAGTSKLSGNVTFTVSGGTFSGDASLTVKMLNVSEGRTQLASDSFTLLDSGGGGGGIPNAPHAAFLTSNYDSSVSSLVQVEYNATGKIGSKSDVVVNLYDSNGNLIASNKTLSKEGFKGTANLTFPSGTISGDTSVTAKLYDANQAKNESSATTTLNDQAGSGPPGGSGSFSIDDIKVVDQNAAPGTSATINVTINNTDSSSAQQKVSIFHLDPTAKSVSEIANKTVTVSGNSNKTVSLEVTFSTAGSKRLGVFGGSFNRTTLLVQPSSSISVTGFSAGRTTVEQNQDVTLTATVKNTGSSKDSTLVPLYRDGELVQTVNVTVPANSQKQVTINTSFRKTGSYSVKVGSTSATTITVEKRGTASVANTTLTVIGGTQPTSDVTVQTRVGGRGSRLQFNIMHIGSSDPADLASAGVDITTQFKVVLTVKNFTSRIVMGVGQNLTWSNSPGPGQTTNVTFYVQPLSAQRITNTSVSRNNWPSHAKDKANVGRKSMVSISAFSMRKAPASVRSRLNGATIATNAQLFTVPRYQQGTQKRGPRLRVFVAGPNRTVNDNQYKGSYEAVIPDGILNEWGVTNAGQLRAAYQGSQTQATFTNTPKGIKMSVDIHYSTGNVDVKAGSSDTKAPSASLSSSATSIDEGNSVTLDASGTTDNVGIQKYEWDFDGDGTYEKTTSTASVSHTYSSSGDYTATVRVTDGGGNTNTARVTISVASTSSNDGGNSGTSAPSASLSAGDTTAGETVTLDASGSTDNAGIATYKWDVDGDGSVDARTSSPTLKHTYSSAGTYSPSVTVVDGAGNSDTASASLTVSEPATASISVASASLDSETITVGDSASVSVTVENTGDAAGTASVSLTVDGDTVASQSVDLSAGSSTTITFDISPDSAGEYTVSVNGTLAGTLTVEAATTATGTPNETGTAGTPTETPSGTSTTDTPQGTPADGTPTDTPDDTDDTPTDTPQGTPADETPTSTPTETPPPTTTVGVTETTTATAGTATDGTATAPGTTVTEAESTDQSADATTTSTPGFTGALGVIALLGAGLVALRRRE